MREVEALRKENAYLRERRFVGFWDYCIAEKGFCRCTLCKALERFPEWRMRDATQNESVEGGGR